MESADVGVILDSSILIAGERRGDGIADVLERVQNVVGITEAALSAVTVVELTHGIYRAQTDAHRQRRLTFTEQVYRTVAVYPLNTEVARLAGRIHGEQMGNGVSIDFPDLLIGTTALHLGFDVVTLNVRHFQAIPGLRVISL
jgi:tRNA(fMet)-specific endonuclease VapC